MSRTTNDQILSAIERVDGKIDTASSILSAHGERLAAIEASMKPLIGNGRPGRIDKIEDDLDTLKESKWKQAGFLAGLAILFEPASHYLMHKIGLK
jgi:hypothetical protein